MATNKFCLEDIPAEYAMSLLQMMEQRGVPYEQVLAGSGINITQLMHNPRLSAQQDACLLTNAVLLTNNSRSLGCELGLRSALTMHGFLGYGLLSCTTLGEAMMLWSEFLKLRTTSAALRIDIIDRIVQIQVYDLCPQLPHRNVAMDRLLVSTARLCHLVTGQSLPHIELWLAGDIPSELSSQDQYLLRAKAFSVLHQIRFPASDLDIRLPSANPIMLAKVRMQCQDELTRFSQSDNLVVKIKDILERHPHGYPTLEATAKALHISSRTLKRKLRQQGFSFRSLVDQMRKYEVLRNVTNSVLSMETIATKAGYADAANLTRAFRRWTGRPPSQYRVDFASKLA